MQLAQSAMQLAEGVLIALGCLSLLGGAGKIVIAVLRCARWMSTAKTLRAAGVDPDAVLQAAAVALRRRVEVRLQGGQDPNIAAMESGYQDAGRRAMDRVLAPLGLRSGLVLLCFGLIATLVGIIGATSILEWLSLAVPSRTS